MEVLSMKKKIITLVLSIIMITSLAIPANAAYIPKYSSTTDQNQTIKVMASLQGRTYPNTAKFYRSYATIRFDQLTQGVSPQYYKLNMSIAIHASGGRSFSYTNSGQVDIGNYISCENPQDYTEANDIYLLTGKYTAVVPYSSIAINPSDIVIDAFQG